MASIGRGLLALLAGGAQGAGPGLRATYQLQQGDQAQALREQQAAEQRRQFDVTQQRLQESMNTPLEQLPEDLRSVIGGTQPTMRTNLLGPILSYRQTQQKQSEETSRREAAATSLEQSHPDLAPLVRAGILSQEALGSRVAPKPMIVAPGSDIYTPGKGFETGPSPKLKTEIKAGEDGYYKITTDLQGNVVGPAEKIEGVGPPQGRGVYQRGDIEDQLRLENLTPGTLPYRQRYNDLARQIQVAPGGAVVGAGSGMTGAPAQGGTPPGALASRPALPNPGEREDIAALDSARTMLLQVRDSLKAGKLNDVMGGVFKNPTAAGKRLSEEYLGYGMTDEQRKARGVLATQLQAIKHALIGATRTRPELADIAAAIPDEKSFFTGDTAAQMVPKIDAIVADLDAKRTARENVMGSTGVAVPQRPSGQAPAGPASPPSSGVIRYERDPTTRRLRPVP